MAFRLDNPSLYVKGTADIWVYDIKTGDVVGYSNKLDTSNITSSVNNGEIRAGLGAPVVVNLPDSATFTGEVTAQDFSLQARQLQTGGTLSYNGTIPFRETITAQGTTLTVTNTPVAAYGEPSSNPTYTCLVGNDGKNYQVDPTTKQIVNFTATSGQSYCVRYYIEAASAQELVIPTVFAPSINRVEIRMAAYTAQGANGMNSSFAGYVYIILPRAQFIGGDAGINGSQTENATTSWTFSALAYDEADVTCAECAQDNSVLGYMVYAPCGDVAQAVKALVVIGGGVTVAESGEAQIPVRYVMDDDSLVQPTYTDLTYQSQAQGTATVSTSGVVEGVAAGSTTVTITVTSKPSVTAVCNVTVTGA